MSNDGRKVLFGSRGNSGPPPNTPPQVPGRGPPNTGPPPVPQNPPPTTGLPPVPERGPPTGPPPTRPPQLPPTGPPSRFGTTTTTTTPPPTTPPQVPSRDFGVQTNIETGPPVPSRLTPTRFPPSDNTGPPPTRLPTPPPSRLPQVPPPDNTNSQSDLTLNIEIGNNTLPNRLPPTRFGLPTRQPTGPPSRFGTTTTTTPPPTSTGPPPTRQQPQVPPQVVPREHSTSVSVTNRGPPTRHQPQVPPMIVPRNTISISVNDNAPLLNRRHSAGISMTPIIDVDSIDTNNFNFDSLSSILNEMEDFERNYQEDAKYEQMENIFLNLKEKLKESDLSDLNVVEVDIDKLKI